MPDRHKEELRNDIAHSNRNLSSEVKILMPASDNQIQYMRFRDVIITKQFYIMLLVDFCQAAFWTLILLTALYCQNTEISNSVDDGFFSVGSFGLVYSLGVTAAAQPLVGFASDHIGARFSFCLWLLVCGGIAVGVPLAVGKWRQDETLD